MELQSRLPLVEIEWRVCDIASVHLGIERETGEGLVNLPNERFPAERSAVGVRRKGRSFAALSLGRGASSARSFALRPTSTLSRLPGREPADGRRQSPVGDVAVRLASHGGQRLGNGAGTGTPRISTSGPRPGRPIPSIEAPERCEASVEEAGWDRLNCAVARTAAAVRLWLAGDVWASAASAPSMKSLESWP